MAEATLVTVCSTAEGIMLELTVNPEHQIVSAQFSGAADPRMAALLTAFVDDITGKPIIEASDHGVIRLESRLRVGRRPVAGITLPENADSRFALVLRLIRGAYKEYRAQTRVRLGDNTFSAPPSDQWLAMTEAARLEAVNTEIASLLGLWGYDPLAIRAIENDAVTRFTVVFRQGVSVSEKPALLMRLEHELRTRTDRAIELFVAEVKDENALRRL